MALEITQAFYDSLPYDLATELASYTAAMEAHKLTVDQPAPFTEPLVEAAFREGGYTIVPEPTIPVNPFDPLFNAGPTMKQILGV
jgi:hypothetical protein